MKALINNTLLRQSQPKSKAYDVWDTKLTGFILRVLPSGRKVYRCEYARGKRITIGDTNLFTSAQARDKAKEILGQAASGKDPRSKKANGDQLTLSKFIATIYAHWLSANRKDPKPDLDRLNANFAEEFGAKKLTELSVLAIEKWRNKRLSKVKPATVNRDVGILKAALSRAKEWEILQENPLKNLKPLKLDQNDIVRFLSPDEEQRLRAVLDEREDKMRQERESGNRWRQQRDYPLLAPMLDKQFADYLKPMVLLAINTGIRRGELFNLTWDKVDLKSAILTITGDQAKSRKTRHIPLNSEALSALKIWSAQSDNNTPLVFPK